MSTCGAHTQHVEAPQAHEGRAKRAVPQWRGAHTHHSLDFAIGIWDDGWVDLPSYAMPAKARQSGR